MRPKKVRVYHEVPPLGLTPKDAWEAICKRDRVFDILDAMHRYSDARKPIPNEWVEELGNLLESFLYPVFNEEAEE